MLLTIPISMHCLSNKRSIGRSFIVAEIINGGDGVIKEQAEDSGNFSCNCFPRFERSLSVEKNGKREVLFSHSLSLNEDISAGSAKKEKQVCYDAMTHLVCGRWKACIVRDSLLDISNKDETEGIQVFFRFCGDKCLQNSSGFFKFYKYLLVFKNNQSNFDSLFFWENRNKRDLNRLQATQLGNDSLGPAVLNSHDRASLESGYSADHRGDTSGFHSEQEAFSNLSSFTFCEKMMPFRDCISGLDCDRNGEGFPILHTYSQRKNEVINRLTKFLSIIEKSNLIFNGATAIDVSNSVKSGKGFPLKTRGDISLTGIYGKRLGLAGGIRLNLDEIIPNYFQIPLGIPRKRKISNRSENTTFLN